MEIKFGMSKGLLHSFTCVMSSKPLHALGGGTRRVFNVQNSNKLNFANIFLLSKLDTLKSIAGDEIPGDEPGDEPNLYINSKMSRQESVQKRFYQCGYHKKTGKCARAVPHLVETNCSNDNT